MINKQRKKPSSLIPLFTTIADCIQALCSISLVVLAVYTLFFTTIPERLVADLNEQIKKLDMEKDNIEHANMALKNEIFSLEKEKNNMILNTSILKEESKNILLKKNAYSKEMLNIAIKDFINNTKNSIDSVARENQDYVHFLLNYEECIKIDEGIEISKKPNIDLIIRRNALCVNNDILSKWIDSRNERTPEIPLSAYYNELTSRLSCRNMTSNITPADIINRLFSKEKYSYLLPEDYKKIENIIALSLAKDRNFSKKISICLDENWSKEMLSNQLVLSEKNITSAKESLNFLNNNLNKTFKNI
jgi:hypothetical protein